MKSCRQLKGERDKGKRARVQKSSSQLLPVRESSDGVLNILHSTLQDHATSHIRTDEMICHYGVALYAKRGREESQHRYMAQKLRELGRFVLAAKEINKQVTYVILHIFSWQLKQPGGCPTTMQAEVNMESHLLLLKLANNGPANKDIYGTLSPVEKQLCHRLTRLVTRAKRGRKIPILLLGRTQASLDFLVKKTEGRWRS